MSQQDAMLEDVVGRLRRNEDGYTTLQLQMNPAWEAADVYAVADALRMNHTLQGIEFFGILADDDVNVAVTQLFASFGRLPKLSTLKVSGYCGNGGVRALSQVIHRSQMLETLHITYVQLDGLDQDFISLVNSLQQHSSLQNFHIVDCQLPVRFRRRDASSLCIMDMIIQVLPEISSLREVVLSPIEKSSLGPISSNALVSICQSTSMTHLKITDFAEFNPREVGDSFAGSSPLVMMAMALATNECLRELCIPSSYSKAQCRALAHLLRNNTTLVQLEIIDVSDFSGNEKNIIEIAESLKSNTTLKRLSFPGICNRFSYETLKAFANSMETNMSITEFTVLQTFTSANNHIWVSRIELFIKLNRYGRGEFLSTESLTKEQWLNKLLEVHDDLDCLFYFLTLSPSYLV